MKISTKIKIINFVKRVLSYKETPEIYHSKPIKYEGVEYEVVSLSKSIELSPEDLRLIAPRMDTARAEQIIENELAIAIVNGEFIKIEKLCSEVGVYRRHTIVGKVLVLKPKQQNNERETSKTY